MHKHITTAAACLFAATTPAVAQDTHVLTFDGAENGQVLRDLGHGVRMTARDTTQRIEGVAFDTALTGPATSLSPNLLQGTDWSQGNLAGAGSLGNALVLQANDLGLDDGVADQPEALATNPAGRFIFKFNTPIVSFGLDLIGVSPTDNYKGGYFMGLYKADKLMGRVPLRWLETRHRSNPIMQAIYDRQAAAHGDIELGEHSANRIAAINASDFGFDSFDRVVVGMRGEGAIDNLSFTDADQAAGAAVPTPAALLPGLLLLGSLTARRRRDA